MIVFILLLVLGVFMMLPLIYSIVTSFKPIEELFVFPPRFFVTQPTLSNYKSLFNIVVMALLFNTTVLWIPQYFIMSKLHIINTYLVYINVKITYNKYLSGLYFAGPAASDRLVSDEAVYGQCAKRAR